MASQLNNHFSKIYCVNMDRRTDRWNESVAEFAKFGIENVERYSAVDGSTLDMAQYRTKLKPGELGLILTNIAILEKCKAENIETVLILEDDVVFTDEINNVSSYFEKLPNDWDMLYFGGNHNTHMPHVQPPIKVNEKVWRLHTTYTTHCVAIKSKMYDKILNALKMYQNPLDVDYSYLQRSNFVYSFYPAMALQRVGFSDIQSKVEDYNWLIK